MAVDYPGDPGSREDANLFAHIAKLTYAVVGMSLMKMLNRRVVRPVDRLSGVGSFHRDGQCFRRRMLFYMFVICMTNFLGVCLEPYSVEKPCPLYGNIVGTGENNCSLGVENLRQVIFQ
ncbi:hypothetical protein Trydic_g16203 [Trypoxylus dichotomus]